MIILLKSRQFVFNVEPTTTSYYFEVGKSWSTRTNSFWIEYKYKQTQQFKIHLNKLSWVLYFLILLAVVVVSNSHFKAFAQGIKIVRVISNLDAGGGSSSEPINQFKPPTINITENETLKWINPTTGDLYPHTVTFISNTNDVNVPNMTIALRNESMNPQQIIDLITSKVMDQGRNASENIDLYLNASVIKSSVEMAEFLDPLSNFDSNGAEYALNGTEKFVNSGLLWNSVKDILSDYPKSFTVRFPVLGVYHFQCLIHPEMKGTITVTPRTNGTLTDDI